MKKGRGRQTREREGLFGHLGGERLLHSLDGEVNSDRALFACSRLQNGHQSGHLIAHVPGSFRVHGGFKGGRGEQRGIPGQRGSDLRAAGGVGGGADLDVIRATALPEASEIIVAPNYSRRRSEVIRGSSAAHQESPFRTEDHNLRAEEPALEMIL